MTRKKDAESNAIAESLQGPGGPPPVPNGQKAPPLTRRQRFLKHAPRRLQQVLYAMRRLGNCGAAASYEWRDSDRDEIFAAVDQAAKQMKGRYMPEALQDREATFRFSSEADEAAFEGQ